MSTETPPPYNLPYNLARFHRVGRRYELALRLHQDALAQREQTLGPDHPDTVRSLTSLANTCYAAGRYPEALELFQEALARRERTLGPEHPDTLRSRGSLGNCYQAMGHYAEACRRHRETLALRERILGPEHPSAQASLSNLARAEAAAALARGGNAPGISPGNRL